MNIEQPALYTKPNLIRSYHYNDISSPISSTTTTFHNTIHTNTNTTNNIPSQTSLIPISVLYTTYIKKHLSFINIIGCIGIFVFILGTFFQTSFLKNKLKKHEYRSTFKRT